MLRKIFSVVTAVVQLNFFNNNIDNFFETELKKKRQTAPKAAIIYNYLNSKEVNPICL